ncbi:MAG: hypothetical protein WCG06_03400, partial [Candidatus Omnitrophota bacterium]
FWITATYLFLVLSRAALFDTERILSTLGDYQAHCLYLLSVLDGRIPSCEQIYVATHSPYFYYLHAPITHWLLAQGVGVGVAIRLTTIVGILIHIVILIGTLAIILRMLQRFIRKSWAAILAFLAIATNIPVFQLPLWWNQETLSFFFACAVIYATVCMIDEGIRPKKAVLLCLATGLGLLVKYTILLPVAVSAIFLCFVRDAGWKKAVLIASLFAIVTVGSAHLYQLSQSKNYCFNMRKFSLDFYKGVPLNQDAPVEEYGKFDCSIFTNSGYYPYVSPYVGSKAGQITNLYWTFFNRSKPAFDPGCPRFTKYRLISLWTGTLIFLLFLAKVIENFVLAAKRKSVEWIDFYCLSLFVLGILGALFYTLSAPRGWIATIQYILYVIPLMIFLAFRVFNAVRPASEELRFRVLITVITLTFVFGNLLCGTPLPS